MKKFVIFIFLIIILSIGCSDSQNNNEQSEKLQVLKELRDSVGELLQFGMLYNDSDMLRQALILTDSILKMDTTMSNKYNCYYNKCMIFNVLKEEENAFNQQEQMVMLLPNNNILRLTFMVTKYIKKIQKDSTDYYIRKTMEVIEDSLKHGYNETLVGTESEMIYIKDGADAAIDYITHAIEINNKSDILKYYLELYSSIVDKSAKSDSLNVDPSDEEYATSHYLKLRNNYLKLHK